ncbi:hypothetical protein LTR03_017443 [Friedmanniomyces endolithicus]|nr:hypothetical protein LTR03_017443 [Friedmanniomyces endolithicus]
MEFDQAFVGNGDWNFPSPGATPTNPTFGNVFQTPKTATFPSHFQDAFNTPQMQVYTTPQQPQYSSMTPVQRQHTSSETLRSNYYAGVQAGYSVPEISPGIHHGFQISPAQQATQMSLSSSQMQTPPPTRGMSAKKTQQPTQIAFGTPSTIASRRFLTPQQEMAGHAMVLGSHTPMPLAQMQFSQDMYQFANMGPASAPVMPQTQLLWDHMGTPMTTLPQQSPLEDPFAPAMQHNPPWSGQLQAMSFETPAMASFPVQPLRGQPMSTAAMDNRLVHRTPVVPISLGLDPSLIYSSPLRPTAQSGSRSSKGRLEKCHVKRKDSAMTSTSHTASISPVHSEPAIFEPGLYRSNTTGPARPSSAQSTANLLETLNRSSSFTQTPRTASPLKRIGRNQLGSISEHKPRHRASVILTVDENGIARTETTRAEQSPTRSVRDRYPGLFDSDTSDDESDTSEQPPSRSASFTFIKGEERRTKAARLDPPIENLEGLSIPRSSSRASNKSVTPSRAAIAAAAQLRRQGSVKRPSRAASAKRNTMSSSTGSLIDSCPMDISTAEQQQAVASANMRNGSNDWAAMSGQGRSALDAHNRRWSMMSFEQHQIPAHTTQVSHISHPQHTSLSCTLSQKRLQAAGTGHVSHFPMFEPDRKKSPGKLFAMLAYEALRNQRHSRRPYSYPPRQYFDLTKADIVALASVLIAPPPPYSSASAAFPHEIRRLIADLPSHLRCRCPCLSTFCAAHRRLNPRPLISLFNSIRRTIEHELHTHWTPLSAEGSLTTAQGHLITRLNLHTWHVNGNTCAACAISRFAIDITLLLALGALTLATLSLHNWRKSKRLFFLESQLQLLHDLRLGSNAETSKQDMFELGSELRRIRERLRLLHDRRSSGRPHVAEAVTRYYDASAPPPRPPRSPEQDDHVLIAASLSPKGGHLAEIAELMSSGGGTTSKSTVRRKPVPATGRKVSVFDEAFQSRGKSRNREVEDRRTSVHLKDSASAAERTFQPDNSERSVTVESHDSECVDSCGPDQPFTSSRRNTAEFEVASPLPPPPSPRRYSWCKLDPIIVSPRRRLGVGAGIRTSGLALGAQV